MSENDWREMKRIEVVWSEIEKQEAKTIDKKW